MAGWVLKAVYFAVFCVFVLVTALSGAACSAKWASYTGKLNGNEVGVISVILPKSVEVCSPSGGSTVCTTRDNDASTLYVSSAAISGYKGTYALSIITAIAGGFGIATSLALLLIELGVLKVARKLLTIVTVVLGWLAVATSAAACVAFGAGVHPNFVNGQALFSGALPTGLSFTTTFLDGLGFELTALFVALFGAIGACLLLARASKDEVSPGAASAV